VRPAGLTHQAGAVVLEVTNDAGETIRYITAVEVSDHLGPDVVPDMLRDWQRRRLITGYRVGKATYYRIDEVREVEYVLRSGGRGRKRRPT
jgi:hypothetical protein